VNNNLSSMVNKLNSEIEFKEGIINVR
jgi:hypothetical protein